VALPSIYVRQCNNDDDKNENENDNENDISYNVSDCLWHTAPEVLNDGGHGPAVDWWGLGVLLYILLCQEPPFYAESNREMFEMIRKDEPPFWDQPHLSEHALSILKGFLTKDPDLRLGSGENGIQDIKQHPFFASIDWEQMLHKQVAPPWQPAMGETPGAQIPVRRPPWHTCCPLHSLTPLARSRSLRNTCSKNRSAS